jgi:succinate-semialdehyde dehydrogenase/glutarate-semialdehyde dehydrogenase
VTIGPLINDKAIAKVEKLVREAVEQGAKATVGGGRHALGGLFWQPTVLTGATPTCGCSRKRSSARSRRS